MVNSDDLEFLGAEARNMILSDVETLNTLQRVADAEKFDTKLGKLLNFVSSELAAGIETGSVPHSYLDGLAYAIETVEVYAEHKELWDEEAKPQDNRPIKGDGYEFLVNDFWEAESDV